MFAGFEKNQGKNKKNIEIIAGCFKYAINVVMSPVVR